MTAPPDLVHAMLALLPVGCLAIAAAWMGRDRRRWGAAAVATAWAVPALAAVSLAAPRLGWWTVAGGEQAIFAIPAELLGGWAVAWATLPALFADRLPVAVVAGAAIVVDVAVFPRAEPVLVAGERWLVGEAVAVAVVIPPALLAARWMLRGDRLGARSSLQLAAVTLLFGWMIPYGALGAEGRPFPPEDLPAWTFAAFTFAAVPLALAGGAALVEFVVRGSGTPVPTDPPRRLVTSGPYAYVANPMQTAATGLLAAASVVLGSWALALAAAVAAAFSAALARWSEHADLARRFGSAWTEYRATHRLWLPRWRPRIGEAELFVDSGCGSCTGLGAWLAAARPVGLAIRDAADHPGPLRRLTYRSGDFQVDGIRALARALDHTNLGLAVAGWLLRLPGVWHAAQAVGDAVGAGPRPAETAKTEACTSGPRLS